MYHLFVYRCFNKNISYTVVFQKHINQLLCMHVHRYTVMWLLLIGLVAVYGQEPTKRLSNGK